MFAVLILEKLRITRHPPGTVAVKQGDCLTVACEAVGFPYPHYHWFQGNKQVSNSSDGQLTIANVRLVSIFCLGYRQLVMHPVFLHSICFLVANSSVRHDRDFWLQLHLKCHDQSLVFLSSQSPILSQTAEHS